MFELKLQNAAVHFQEITIWNSYTLESVTGVWQSRKPNFPTAAKFILASHLYYTSRSQTLRPLTSPFSDYTCPWATMTGHLLWMRSMPILGDHRAAGRQAPHHVVWSKSHLRFLFCICVYMLSKVVCACIHIYTHTHIFVHIYKISESYTVRC